MIKIQGISAIIYSKHDIMASYKYRTNYSEIKLENIIILPLSHPAFLTTHGNGRGWNAPIFQLPHAIYFFKKNPYMFDILQSNQSVR